METPQPPTNGLGICAQLDAEGRRAYTPSQAASLLGVDRSTATRWAHGEPARSGTYPPASFVDAAQPLLLADPIDEARIELLRKLGAKERRPEDPRAVPGTAQDQARSAPRVRSGDPPIGTDATTVGELESTIRDLLVMHDLEAEVSQLRGRELEILKNVMRRALPLRAPND